MIEKLNVVAQVEEFLSATQNIVKAANKVSNRQVANLSSLVQMMANTIIAATM